jgi:secondary thiamine-phosphate synthase enzyme
MKIFQQAITLKQHTRGFHLITHEVVNAVPEMKQIEKGICQVFIQHTSASLTINENADPTVRKDFERYFNRIVPESRHDYLHNNEGPDDMPAHLKAAMLGSSVSIPVSRGRLALGTWQGIYLCEHRDAGGPRELVITVWGD